MKLKWQLRNIISSPVKRVSRNRARGSARFIRVQQALPASRRALLHSRFVIHFVSVPPPPAFSSFRKYSRRADEEKKKKDYSSRIISIADQRILDPWGNKFMNWVGLESLDDVGCNCVWKYCTIDNNNLIIWWRTPSLYRPKDSPFSTNCYFPISKQCRVITISFYSNSSFFSLTR